ncbi:MAG TPA: transcriptional regulator [Xanthomonadaceae bacterium]|nr:transcriptional regulator [Xanthomonadaceae bacterium]
MSKLYERIREARRLTALTQEALAAELGVTRSAVAQWEMADGTAPSVENLIGLAQRSGLRFEYLATGRGERVFGPPAVAVAEVPAKYRPLSEQQQQLLERFEALAPRQKTGLIDLLSSGARGKRTRR